VTEVKYSGSNIRADIEIVTQTLLNEAESLVNQLVLDYAKRRRQPGKTALQIANEIADEVMNGTGVMQGWINRNNKIVNNLTKELVNRPMEELAGDKKKRFNWVLGSVKTEHCPDCLRMSKISESEGPKTTEEWRSYGVGLPREGETECSYGCRCMLL
jgi:hypothetical protein